jgi:hypothetical protein
LKDKRARARCTRWTKRVALIGGKCSARTREASGRSKARAMHVPVHCFYAPVFAAVLAPTDAAAAACTTTPAAAAAVAAAAAAGAADDDCPVAAVATTVATAELGAVIVVLPAAPRARAVGLVVAGDLVKKLDMDGCSFCGLSTSPLVPAGHVREVIPAVRPQRTSVTSAVAHTPG